MKKVFTYFSARNHNFFIRLLRFITTSLRKMQKLWNILMLDLFCDLIESH